MDKRPLAKEAYNVDSLHFLGEIRIRELPPQLDKATWESWWKGLTQQEKDRYTVAVVKNLITTNGRNQILTFIGSASTGTGAFSQYFAIGTFPINRVQPGDTAVNSEIFRAVPSSATISGNTVDISTFLGTAQGNGILTNCGIFGVNATSSTGSGTLMTHALLSYTKDNLHTVTFDYLITLN